MWCAACLFVCVVVCLRVCLFVCLFVCVFACAVVLLGRGVVEWFVRLLLFCLSVCACLIV